MSFEDNLFRKKVETKPDSKQEKEINRKRFDEVPEQEQVKRFLALQGLYADKRDLKRKGAKEEELNRANFFDFLENVDKYTDEFKIEGKTKQQVSDLFSQALAGNKIIKKSLELFLETKKMQSGEKNSVQGSLESLNALIDFDRRQFATSEQKKRQLDVGRLKELFKWSLDTFIKGGEKIGRNPPKIVKGETEALSNDLEDILKHVNQYRQ